MRVKPVLQGVSGNHSVMVFCRLVPYYPLVFRNEGSMHGRIVSSWLAVFILTVAGCVSSNMESAGGGYSLTITLNTDSTLTVGSRTVSQDRLVSAVKAAGATRNTSIWVSIPANTPASAIAPIDSKLRTAGYTRILYRGPKHAEAGPAGAAPGTPGLPARPR